MKTVLVYLNFVICPWNSTPLADYQYVYESHYQRSDVIKVHTAQGETLECIWPPNRRAHLKHSS